MAMSQKTKEERVMSVLIAAMNEAGVVPSALGTVRLEDETKEVRHNSMVVCVEDADEHAVLDGVWNMNGVIRIYIKEVKNVNDEVRREWLGGVEAWLDDGNLLNQVNDVDECVQFFELEVTGVAEWSSEDRSIWGDVSWSAVVEV